MKPFEWRRSHRPKPSDDRTTLALSNQARPPTLFSSMMSSKYGGPSSPGRRSLDSAEGASGEKPGVERSGISANLLQQREGAIIAIIPDLVSRHFLPGYFHL